MGIIAPVGEFISRCGRSWIGYYNRRDTYSSVDIKDPLELALLDTQLLLAFAVQSSRKLSKDKIVALTNAADVLRHSREAGNDPAYAAKASAFWIAFDDFAADLAPLSAYSIRSSIEVNGKCFPASLATPTACNAAFAVIVFAVGMALQGFWVSGKELIDMASAYQVRKSELTAAVAAKQGDAQSAFNHFEALRHKVGDRENCAFEAAPGISASMPRLENVALKPGCAELMQAAAAITEKKLYLEQADNDMQALSEKGRPMMSLVIRWYERAGSVCKTYLVTFLCPVERRNDTALMEVQRQMELARNDLGAQGLLPARIRQAAARYDDPQLNAKRIKLDQLEAAHEKALDAQFASILVQSKMIVANVGAYLIPMFMGMLGSLTFILRSLSQTLRDHTYVPISASVFVVRVCLGAIAGVFGGLLASAGDPAFKSLSLPPLFVPFVFGYGIEILFALLDRVVRTFTQPETGASRPVMS